jgi:hypothetical protein
MMIRGLLGAARITTSGCSSQSRRQAILPPVSLVIRSVMWTNEYADNKFDFCSDDTSKLMKFGGY